MGGGGEERVRRLIVNVFTGVPNLPLVAARDRGEFAREGLEVEVQHTPSSLAQRAAVMDGTAQLAHASVDDGVAGVEDAGADFVAFMGGDGGFQALYARPPAARVADLRGRVMAVDDPETAYALVLQKILRLGGLAETEYVLRAVGSTPVRFQMMQRDAAIAGHMLSPPFSVQAEDLGWRRLGGIPDLLGSYQGTTGFCRRAWVAENRDTLVRYIRAYLAGLRWVLDPANRNGVAESTMAALGIPRLVAERSCTAAFQEGGLAPDAAVDEPGLRGVLAIRAEIRGTWGGTPPPPGRYLDLGPYREVLAGLSAAGR